MERASTRLAHGHPKVNDDSTDTPIFSPQVSIYFPKPVRRAIPEQLSMLRLQFEARSKYANSAKEHRGNAERRGVRRRIHRERDWPVIIPHEFKCHSTQQR